MQVLTVADELFAAFETGVAIEPLTASMPGLTVEEAYRIQGAVMERHAGVGRRIVGRKIGLTSLPMQRQLGISSPDFGQLLDSHVFVGGTTVSRSALRMIAPRIEAEIAYVLDSELRGPGITPEDVRAATRALAPVFELIDSRIRDWRIGLCDTIADNASCLGAVLGEEVDPVAVGPPEALSVAFARDGEVLERGDGTAVMGDPAAAVAWLANQLGEFGEALAAGQPILSGSLTAAIDAVPGVYEAGFGERLGSVSVVIEE